MDKPNNELAALPEVLEVNDLGLFIQTVEAWHTANANMLRHMMHIPSDGSFTVEFEGQAIAMQGDLYRGFIMGCTTALGMFGKLPFEAIVDDSPVDEDDTDTNEQPTH